MTLEKPERKPIGEYSIAELRAICQGTAPNPARESFLGRFSRRFSIYTTRFFIPTKITQNQITWISVITFFVGVTLFYWNNYWLNLVGSIIIFISIVFDGSDGEVARFRGTGGPMGSLYVEPVSHDIQYAFMLIPAGLGFFSHRPWEGGILLFLATLGGVMKLMYRHLELRFWLFKNSQATPDDVEKMKQAHEQKPVWIKFLYWVNKEFFSSTGVFLVAMFASIVSRIEIFIYVYAVGFTLLWLALFTKQVRYLSKATNATPGANLKPDIQVD